MVNYYYSSVAKTLNKAILLSENVLIYLDSVVPNLTIFHLLNTLSNHSQIIGVLVHSCKMPCHPHYCLSEKSLQFSKLVQDIVYHSVLH